MEDNNWKSRTRLLVGDAGIQKLQSAHVLIVGLGGVGSYAAEMICRAGVGKMTIADGDIVDPTNRNRQLQALYSTHGLSKVDLMHQRLKDINPTVEINAVNIFLRPQYIKELFIDKTYTYVIDAIDSLMPKLTLIKTSLEKKAPIISSMGAGGKLDPTMVRVVDISETYNCNLAFYVRKRLRNWGIKNGIDTVFSPEMADKSSLLMTDGSNFKRSAFGTISYLPAVFGCTCASVAIRNILKS